jgi:hypothetical protein
MDAHAWTPGSTQWQPLADALSPVPNTLDTTRPGLTGASGVWDPVAQAVLLAGGRDVATGQLSTALWSIDPAVADGEPMFEKVTTYGDVPPGCEHPVFVVDAEATGWLAGRFEMPDQGGATGAALRVYSLDLSGYSWTLAWDEQTFESPGPDGVLALAGGAGPDGVDLLLVDGAGTLAIWRYSVSTEALTHVPVEDFSTPIAGFAGWVYDRHSRTALVTATTMTGPTLLAVDLGTAAVKVLPMDGAWPSHLLGVAAGLHPSEGALLVGGHDLGGYTTSGWQLAGQICD